MKTKNLFLILFVVIFSKFSWSQQDGNHDNAYSNTQALTIQNVIHPTAGSIGQGRITSSIPLSNGKILVAGNFNNSSNTLKQIALISGTNSTIPIYGYFDYVINNNGSLGGQIYSMSSMPNGNVIACGYYDLYNGQQTQPPSSTFRRNLGMIMLNSTLGLVTNINGSSNPPQAPPDYPSFNFNGLLSWYSICSSFSVIVDSSNNVYVAMEKFDFSDPNVIEPPVLFTKIIKFNSLGIVDTTFFNNSPNLDSTITDIEFLSDGSIIATGQKTLNFNGIMKISSNGTLDTTFNANIGNGIIGSQITSVEIDSNNKIFLMGDFTQFNNVATNNYTKINADGTNLPLTSFNSNDLSINNISLNIIKGGNVKMQPDGKVLFTRKVSNTSYSISRILSNGNLDNCFVSEISDDFINHISISNIGGNFIYASGGFHNWIRQSAPVGNIAVNSLVRLKNGNSPSLIATNDTFTLNCPTTITPSILTNDTLNGNAIPVPLNGYTITQVAPFTSGVFSINNNGIVSSLPDQYGTFVIYYQLQSVSGCGEASNVATITIIINPSPQQLIVTNDDINICISPGTSSTYTIQSNDTFGGVLNPSLSNLTIGLVSTQNTGISINPNGTIRVAQGTPAGIYNLQYRLCQKCVANKNCSLTSIITITVNELKAFTDFITADTSGVLNQLAKEVIFNDRFNCNLLVPLSMSQIILTPINTNAISINSSTGIVTIASGLLPGQYSTSYTICEVGNSLNCSTGIVSLTISNISQGIRANNIIRTSNLYGVNDIIITGDFTQYNGLSRNKIAKLNSNLYLDTSSFNTGVGANNAINTVFVDGTDIYLGGAFTNYNGLLKNRIVKLNSTGSLLAFNGSYTADVFDIKKRSDGNLIIVGGFAKGISCLTTSGSAVATFIPGTGANNAIYAVAKYPGTDNRMIIAGRFTSYNGTVVNGIARLNANGTIDGTFNGGGLRFNNPGFIPSTGKFINKILIDGSSIYVVGTFTKYNTSNVSGIVKLLNNGVNDGAIDTSFSSSGINVSLLNSVNDITTIPGDLLNLYIGGNFTSYNGSILGNSSNLLKISKANGARDLSFSPSGNNFTFQNPPSPTVTGYLCSTTILSDGKIIATGYFNRYNTDELTVNYITRLKSDQGNGQGKVMSNDNEIINSITIFPNPSTGIFSIDFKNFVGETSLAVYNMLGQKVVEKVINDLSNYELDLSSYEAGTYFLRINNNNNITTKTIIKN
ncbi:T9SS type A sorting domain-containing protein [Flavobacterium sp.]|uniref:T9SS type A sorting domain-containing protein n=1 Tax=Flavobacterium sp. TaxID=239 RepID=UPI0037513A0F